MDICFVAYVQDDEKIGWRFTKKILFSNFLFFLESYEMYAKKSNIFQAKVVLLQCCIFFCTVYIFYGLGYIQIFIPSFRLIIKIWFFFILRYWNFNFFKPRITRNLIWCTLGCLREYVILANFVGNFLRNGCCYSTLGFFTILSNSTIFQESNLRHDRILHFVIISALS